MWKETEILHEYIIWNSDLWMDENIYDTFTNHSQRGDTEIIKQAVERLLRHGAKTQTAHISKD